jgi:glyoxylate/hydroxypyruvate reductase A
MVDDGLTEGMVEWVTGHVLRHHLGMDTHIHGQDGVWRAGSARRWRAIARSRCWASASSARPARGARGAEFPRSGLVRSPKSIDGVETPHGAGLDATLRKAEIVVLLLPDTPATENTLNARTLALLPRGAVIVNPGRGPLIDDEALLAALDSGQVGHATLDVFRTEPLPPEHPYWAHPKVTVTPHIASETRAPSAARVIAENIRRGEAGEPFLHLVDRAAGY